MKVLLQQQRGLAVVVACLAGLPQLAQAGGAPYVGLELGPNIEGSQDLSQQGAVIGGLKFGTGWGAGIAGGYAFANGLRPELEVSHRRNDIANGPPPGLDVGNFVNADSVFGSLWYDFGGNPIGNLHPYAGGGIGGVHYSYRGITTPAFTYDYATDFGIQLGGGLGMDLNRHLRLSADFRILQTAPGSFNFGDGNTTQLRYRAESLMLRLSYVFGHSSSPRPSAAS